MNTIKSLLGLALLIIAGQAFGQSVFTGKAYIENSPEDTYFFHLKIDDDQLENDWLEFLNSLGKAKVTSKDHIMATGVDLKNISNNVDGVLSRISDDKKYTSIYVVFVDKRGNIIPEAEINDKQASLFLQDFISQAYRREELRIAHDQLKDLKDDKEDAEKKVKKIEGKIQSNLKSQGKINSQIEDAMKAISDNSEKKASLQAELDLESVSQQRKDEIKSELQTLQDAEDKIKASSKTDKKLEKKMNDLEDLKKELDDSKLEVKEKTMIYDSRKEMLDKIK